MKTIELDGAGVLVVDLRPPNANGSESGASWSFGSAADADKQRAEFADALDAAPAEVKALLEAAAQEAAALAAAAVEK